MAIKLALLKSGEQVIADIMELVDENDKVVSLVFTNPYIVRLLTSELLIENNIPDDQDVEHKVSFSPWLVLSSDKKMALNHEWVVTVVEPHDWIKSSYVEKMDAVDSENEKLENFEVLTEESNG